MKFFNWYYKLILALLRAHRKSWTWKHYVANRADPTSVVVFEWGRLELIDSWGIEVRWNGRRIFYGDNTQPRHRFVQRLWSCFVDAAGDIVHPLESDPDEIPY